jgi:hypothetical protein
MRALTDASGVVTDSYEYDAFGNLIAQSGTIYAIASSVQLVGDNAGLHFDDLWTNFKGCSAKVTVSTFGRAWLANFALMGLGAGAGALGEGLFPVEQGLPVGKQVILDTNAVIRFKEAQALLQPGESPVITDQVLNELNDLAARGQIDAVPNVVQQLPVVPDTADVNTQAALRQTLGQFSGDPTGPVVDLNTIQGLSGDATIGTTGILTGSPIITADQALIQALSKLGAAVRGLP